MRRRYMMIQSFEDNVFDPVSFTFYLPASVKAGRRFSASIEATEDVKMVTLCFPDGTIAAQKTQAQANNSSPPYRYSLLATAPTTKGDLTLYAYATDENGKESQRVYRTITVK